MKRVKLVTGVLAICAMMALLVVGTAGAKSYSVPKPKGGTTATKTPAAAGGKTLKSKTGKQLAKGFSITVTFPKGGAFTATVTTGKGKKAKVLGSGTVKSSKAGAASLKITFTKAGKAFLTTSAGKKVTLTVTFTPTSGKSSTSTTTVKLG